MRTVAFEVPGQPISWQVFSRWDASMAKKYLKAYQDTVRVAAREAMHGLPPHEGGIDLAFWFYRQIPPTAGKRQATRDRWVAMHMLMSPDLTNLQKACEDALVEESIKATPKELLGIVFMDDGQVTDISSHKRFAEEAHTSIMVKFL